MVLNFRPDLIAPYIRCFLPAPLQYRDGWLLNIFLFLPPPLQLCTVKIVFTVFLFSGNVISMMVPSKYIIPVLLVILYSIVYELLCCKAKQLQNVEKSLKCIKIAVSLKSVKLTSILFTLFFR